MRKILLLLIVVISATTPVLADPRADEILKQAREAIGGEQKLLTIQGLILTGKYRRVLGDRQMGGDREISISLPGKYSVEDAMNPGGMSTAMINTRAMNGDRAWTESSGGGGGMVFRMGGPGGQQLTPEQMEAALKRAIQVEMARYLLATTLASTSSFILDFKYAGESDVEDIKAEVVDVTGPDRFALRIFFDKQTHLPLLLNYRGPKPRIMTMTRQAGSSHKPEDIKKAREEAEKKMAADGPPVPEEAEFYIRLTEHKKVSGLLLPHKFTFLTDTEVSEEFEISKYQMNPQFKADKFEKH